MSTVKRKLIEVALPLEQINAASKAEKDRKVGKPQQIHHWWARRPIVTARAVLLAQLLDDPSSDPMRFPTSEMQAIERLRLFNLIERLCTWDAAFDEQLLAEANDELRRSNPDGLPRILDPFAGGGAIPLEAQRLGLETVASDLNPVAVVINEALLDLPTRWSGLKPVSADSGTLDEEWPRATGLAADVAWYGSRLRALAVERLGHLYPPVVRSGVGEARPISWLWARTVRCPNPACGRWAPLMRSFALAKKRGREYHLVPSVVGDRIKFKVSSGSYRGETDGTFRRTGATCLACEASIPLDYLREQGVAGQLSQQLLAIVVEGQRRRLYLDASDDDERAALGVPRPLDAPDLQLSTHPQYMGPPRYGLTEVADLYTSRQLAALCTIADAISEVRSDVHRDAVNAGMAAGVGLEAGGDGAEAYSDAVALYLALAVSRLSDWSNALCRWESTGEVSQQLFGKQTVSMVWDFSEAAVLGTSSGSLHACLEAVTRSLTQLGYGARATVRMADARQATRGFGPLVISTDPPYYDNVPYADLSDVFYVWLRRSLVDVMPTLFATIATPKSDELVADQQRHGGRERAANYFERGFTDVFLNAIGDVDPRFPMAVYYAFRQTDSDRDGTASTGWEVLLSALLEAGWAVTATWPMRTEMASRVRGQLSNALASSIVLACRPRAERAEAVTRRGFISALKDELPSALRELHQGSVAPVDLAQAAIGPGMAVFSRYGKVVEADGSDMTVRTALALINQVLDEVLSEQEGDFDADTRFCVKWYSQFGWNEATSGEADVLARATNTSIDGLVRGGIFRAVAGKAGLLSPEVLAEDWDPVSDIRVNDWEVAVRLAKALAEQGAGRAAALMAAAGQRRDLDTVKELAYLLFSLSERRGWTQTALLFNGLGTAWNDLQASARSLPAGPAGQTQEWLTFEDEA